MFKKKLQADLEAIFKTKAVRICSVTSTIEQDVLCVDISEQKIKVQEGIASGRIIGTIAVRGTERKNPAGFLTKKIQQASAEELDRFWFGAKETPVPMPVEWEIKAYQMDFTYFYEEEYAPVKGILEYAKLVWKFIIGEQK